MPHWSRIILGSLKLVQSAGAVLTAALAMFIPVAAAASPVPEQETIDLNGEWKVARLPIEDKGATGYRKFLDGKATTIRAQVPGEIHLDLMRAGEMKDPSVGENSRKDRWPERFSWWYSTRFSPSDNLLRHDSQCLIFDGLLYDAEVYLNGAQIGTSRNGLSAVQFDVTGMLKPGSNDLVVRLTSGFESIGQADQHFDNSRLYANRENFAARSGLRIPAYTSGWDWNDTLPNIGIWRGVRLEGHSRAMLRQVRVETELQGNRAFLAGEVTIINLRQWVHTDAELRLSLEGPNHSTQELTRKVNLNIGTNFIPFRLEVRNPKLWWPNGMGGQPLYKLKTVLVSEGSATDAETQTIGLRTVQLDQSPCAGGSHFRFIVNGKPMFAMGGNWAPDDQIPARMTAGRYNHLIEAAKDAHFNLLRVNGVGYYEDDVFYEACDRAGILLWQEFAYSCTTYDDLSPLFMDGVRKEAEDFVLRVAHHPSLALWCGCNECLWMYAGGKNRAPSEAAGFRIYLSLLPSVLHELDPTKPYIAGSPSGGADDINSQKGGDVHWWYEVFMSGDLNRKMNPALLDECKGRFVSEYGIIGPPSVTTMKEYLEPGDLNPSSLAWRIHTNSYEGDHIGFTEAATRHHFFGDGPMSIEQFSFYGGLYQAMMQGAMIEANRFRKNDPSEPCEGNLMWSYNDCWGEVGWSIIDHYGRRKPSFYAVKRAYAPIKVLVRSRGDQLITRVINDSPQAQSVEVRYGWVRVDGTARNLRTRRLTVPAGSMIELGRDKRDGAPGKPSEWIYAATLSGAGIDDQSVWRLTPCRELQLSKPTLTVKFVGSDLIVLSDAYAVGVHLVADERTQLSDDFFDLLPGVPHVVHIVKPAPDGAYRLQASMPRS